MYGSHSKADHGRNINAGYGQGHVYCGKLLVTVKSNEKNPPDGELNQILDYTPKSIESLSLPKTKDYLLFATIYDANMIEQKKSHKQLHFEISLGCNGTAEDGSKSNETDSYRPEKIDTGRKVNHDSEVSTPDASKHRFFSKSHDTSKYCRLNFGQDSETKKPCMHLTSTLPDHEYRIKNRVRIKSIITSLDIDVKRLISVYENTNKENYHIYNSPLKTSSEAKLLSGIKTVVVKAVKKLKDILKGISLKDEHNVNDLDHKLAIKRIKYIVSLLYIFYSFFIYIQSKNLYYNA